MVAYSILEVVFGACDCKGTFDCQSTIDANGGIVIWALITLYMFKALGTVCDEYFVPSLEMISEKLELSNDVAGATFMAAGSSAPELFTSIVATFLIINEGGVGAIIGSAIFNILVIVGATCVFAGQVLDIWWYPLARDCSFYVLSIVELALFIMDDEVIQWWEALIMFLSYVAYCVYMKFNEKVATLIRKETKVDIMDVEQRYGVAGDSPVKDGDDSPCNQSEGDKADIADKKEHKEKKKDMEVGFTAIVQTVAIPNDIPSKSVETGEGDAASSTSGGTGGTGDPGHMHIVRSMKELKRQKTFAAAFTEAEAKKFSAVLEQQNESSERSSVEKDENLEEEEEKCWRKYAKDPLNLIWELIMPTPERYWSLFFMSILNIAFCTYIMVDAVNRSGCDLNVQPLVMGLIFLAAGTSVPDALGSIAVAQQGEGDMAVANALGSNVFDILLGLGVPWLISALMGNNVTFKNASADLFYWICVLAGVLVLFIAALFFTRWKLNKTMGVILMTLYFIHVAVALLRTFGIL